MIGITSDIGFAIEMERLGINKSMVASPLASPMNKCEVASPCEVIDIKHGRTIGKEEIAHEVRALIAGEAIAGADVNQLAESFHVSKSSISAYKNDATSTTSYHSPNTELANSNEQVRNRIIGPAQSKLIAAINAISPDKLNEAKVNVASAVARDMSSIIKNMEPDAGVTVNNNRVVIYKPRMKEEDDYESIVVNE